MLLKAPFVLHGRTQLLSSVLLPPLKESFYQATRAKLVTHLRHGQVLIEICQFRSVVQLYKRCCGSITEMLAEPNSVLCVAAHLLLCEPWFVGFALSGANPKNQELVLLGAALQTVMKRNEHC